MCGRQGMNRAILKRLRRLEAQFPEPPVDLSAVTDKDLEALEHHMALLIAGKVFDEHWHEKLPPRLQRLYTRLWPDRTMTSQVDKKAPATGVHSERSSRIVKHSARYT